MEYDPFDAQDAEPERRMIVFGFRDLHFALPIADVYKIVPRPAVVGSGLGPVGLAHVGDEEVTVFDLHRRLFGTPFTHDGEGYLVLFETPEEELVGIPIAEPPGMFDIKESAIRTLPESFRRRDTYGLASHVALVAPPEDPERELNIFFLDLAELFGLFEPQKLLT